MPTNLLKLSAVYSFLRHYVSSRYCFENTIFNRGCGNHELLKLLLKGSLKYLDVLSNLSHCLDCRVINLKLF